jgi:histone acetyltransferase (RNA polymerase elongator complex component)
MNRRGHTAEDVRNAAVLIREYGFELGLQMMTGLPGDTDEGAIETAKKLLALKPDTMRVYPTIVLENTEICDWYRAGTYTPQTLEAAVSLCAELIPMIENAGVRLIRVGLHASEELEHRAAGPFHPAFMELCRSRIFLEAITAELRKKQINTAEVAVAPQMLSIALGQKRSNMEALSNMGYKVTVKPDSTLSGRTYRLEETGR